jgi:outer membrane lipopolysaccharide assembly protein LptE/RlpB
MKKVISVLLLLFLSGCGYSAIYKNDKPNNLILIINSMQGEKEINNLIKNQLELYSSKNSSKKFNINLNSDFIKTIISKNANGTIANYELYLKVEFEIEFEGKEELFSFQERFKIKNISDSFEQKNYENIIKNNFASSIRKKLILKLLNM